MVNTTTATDISIEKLSGYSGLLEELKEKNKTEIDGKIDEINGLLAANVGSTSSPMPELNTYISDLYKQIVSLVNQTGKTVDNISCIFAEEDTEDAAIIKSK